MEENKDTGALEIRSEERNGWLFDLVTLFVGIPQEESRQDEMDTRKENSCDKKRERDDGQGGEKKEKRKR
jgi:hypothetical protein